MLTLLVIAGIIAVGIAIVAGALFWVCSSICSPDVDAAEAYVADPKKRAAAHALQASELRYAILEDLEVDEAVLEHARQDVLEARARCDDSESASAPVGESDAASVGAALAIAPALGSLGTARGA